MPGMKSTVNGLNPFVCVSALQKCIRRGMEREAMEFAVELARTSKAYFSWACNRIEICSHEDIGLADPAVVVFAALAIEQARRHYKAERLGESMIMVDNAVRLMCRALKSREGDHYQAACMLRSELDGYIPPIPEFAIDKHSHEGRQLGRGVEHFRSEGGQLRPAPLDKDAYEEEAYELWMRQEGRRKGAELFEGVS